MRVNWNQKQSGFQKCWLWQYGAGPFEVIEVKDQLYRIATLTYPKAAFHNKWLIRETFLQAFVRWLKQWIYSQY
ncbi:MAG: hypothetical protein DWQ19_10280 [Crenarchaeota archaeon]|nr:MAG: hypothetical protein DWQ19_10280 [Thermoproteota archaeon]